MMLKYRNEKGISTVEAILAVGMVGLLVLVGSKVSTFSLSANRKLELGGHAVDVANVVRGEMDCLQTMLAIGTTCDGKTEASNTYVRLLKKDRSVLVDTAPFTPNFGDNIHLRARCFETDAYYQFLVESRRQKIAYIDRKPVMVALPDPLTKKTSEWRNILDEAPVAGQPPARLPLACLKPPLLVTEAGSVSSDASDLAMDGNMRICLNINGATATVSRTRIEDKYAMDPHSRWGLGFKIRTLAGIKYSPPLPPVPGPATVVLPGIWTNVTAANPVVSSWSRLWDNGAMSAITYSRPSPTSWCVNINDGCCGYGGGIRFSINWRLTVVPP